MFIGCDETCLNMLVKKFQDLSSFAQFQECLVSEAPDKMSVKCHEILMQSLQVSIAKFALYGPMIPKVKMSAYLQGAR